MIFIMILYWFGIEITCITAFVSPIEGAIAFLLNVMYTYKQKLDDSPCDSDLC